MPRPQGLPKTGGRVRGVPNRKTTALRELLNINGCEPVTQLLRLMPELEPKQRADIYLDLIQYLYPKRKALEQDIDLELIELFRELENKSEEELLAIVNGHNSK